MSIFRDGLHWGIAIANARIDPYEDPEHLLVESLEHLEEEARLLGAVTTWLRGYGHLLLTKKLKFRSNRGRRLFSALLEASGSDELKLRRMIQRPTDKQPEFVFRNLLPTEKKMAQSDPDPHFLRHGFWLKRHELVRPEILYPPEGVFRRSAILRARALYGATLRSDLLVLLPNRGLLSLRELSRQLHVGPSAIHFVIDDYVRSGLIRRTQAAGRGAKLEWVGSGVLKAG